MGHLKMRLLLCPHQSPTNVGQQSNTLTEAKRTETILVVDDDEEVRRAAVKMLNMQD